MKIMRVTLVLFASSLLAFSGGAEEELDLKEFKQDLKASFSPLMDTLRGQQLALLADAYSSEVEGMKKLVPYLIHNLLKQEIDHLESAEYEDQEMEAFRKEILIKLLEARKSYIDYADISKLNVETDGR